MTSAVQHTTTQRMISWLVVLGVMLAPLAVPRAVAQDARAEARQHYVEGKSRFGAGDYQGAIREFEAANRLAPSPILHFNIGLAYERLGNRAEALRHYRTYLQEMPQAPNRSGVEAQIQRLETEMRQAQTPAPAPVVPQPDATAGGAGGAAATGDAVASGVVGAVSGRATGGYGSESAGAVQQAPGGSGVVTGQPSWGAGMQETAPAPAGGPDTTAMPGQPSSTPAPAPTGDPLLDRVAAIDVALVRDQRAEAINLAPAPQSVDVPVESGESEKEAKPTHKQVWFWVVAGVSALILLDIALSGQDEEPDTFSAGGGPALLRF